MKHPFSTLVLVAAVASQFGAPAAAQPPAAGPAAQPAAEQPSAGRSCFWTRNIRVGFVIE